ncbi:MAG: transposase [Haliea sp.]
MGAERPLSAALPVRQPPRCHGPGARHRLPLHRHAPDQEGGVLTEDGPGRRGHADPALRQCAQPQRPLPHAVPRRGLRRAACRLAAVPLGEGTDQRRVGRADSDPRARIGRFLERQGLLERDAENSYLAGDAFEAGPMEQLLGSSITYRIAVGPQQGRKVFTLQTLPACDEAFDAGVGKVAGFSLHAGVAARADQRQKLERLCRYISRPAIAEKRLSLTSNGNVRYQLKTPYRDGTTHVIFEPLDFIARLAALVPKPRVNLTRFHGVFAPNSKYRARVTPATRGRGGRHATTADPEERTPAERRAAMTWAQRLKRVFGIDIETCPACGGSMRVIACIEAPDVIEKILDHLDSKTAECKATQRPPSRAPPQRGLFDETV